MSIEGNPNTPENKETADIDAAMERLKDKIFNKEENSCTFKSENGFSVSINFYNEGYQNITLEKSGLISVFDVPPDSVPRLMELRGPDGENVDNENIMATHYNEIVNLSELGKLKPSGIVLSESVARDMKNVENERRDYLVD
jgi:hypothetical protein